MFDLQKTIVTIVADHAGRPEAEIQPSHRFKEDLGMDSLTHIEMVMSLEEAFKLQLSEEEVATLRTVQNAIAFVQGHSDLSLSA